MIMIYFYYFFIFHFRPRKEKNNGGEEAGGAAAASSMNRLHEISLHVCPLSDKFELGMLGKFTGLDPSNLITLN